MLDYAQAVDGAIAVTDASDHCGPLGLEELAPVSEVRSVAFVKRGAIALRYSAEHGLLGNMQFLLQRGFQLAGVIHLNEPERLDDVAALLQKYDQGDVTCSIVSEEIARRHQCSCKDWAYGYSRPSLREPPRDWTR